MTARRSLDELRDAFPALGFCLYALEPGEGVTLEVHAEGDVYSFVAATEDAVIERAFPTKTADIFD